MKKQSLKRAVAIMISFILAFSVFFNLPMSLIAADSDLPTLPTSGYGESATSGTDYVTDDENGEDSTSDYGTGGTDGLDSGTDSTDSTDDTTDGTDGTDDGTNGTDGTDNGTDSTDGTDEAIEGPLAPSIPDAVVFPMEVLLDHTTLHLEYGLGADVDHLSANVTATVFPEYATDLDVVWAIVPDSVVYADEENPYVVEFAVDGNTVVITAIGEGTATLRAAAVLYPYGEAAVFADVVVVVTHVTPTIMPFLANEPTPDFDGLFDAFGYDVNDWDYAFGSNFDAGTFGGFSDVNDARVSRTNEVEILNDEPWNHFLQFHVPDAGGGGIRHFSNVLPNPVEAHQAFVTFDMRPGTVRAGSGDALNYVDHALVSNGVPLLIIRNQSGRLIASGDVTNPQTGGDGHWNTLGSYVPITSVSGAGWNDQWYTLGIFIDFINTNAIIYVMERGAFNAGVWTYGTVLGTYTVPIAGDSISSFRISSQRNSGQNVILTNHGFDNLHFFSRGIPVTWNQIGDTIDFANPVPGASNNNTTVIAPRSFAGQTVLNANPHATHPATTWGNTHAQWALPLDSGDWDIGAYNMVRVEFDFWTEWQRQHTLGWEARFNSNNGIAAFDGTLFGVRSTSNGLHPPAATPVTFLRHVTSESGVANARNEAPGTTTLRTVPRHTLNRVELEINLVTQMGRTIIRDADGVEVARVDNITLPTDQLGSFSFGAVRDGGNTWFGPEAAWFPAGPNDHDYGAKINNISIYGATYGGVRPTVHPTSVVLTPSAAQSIEFGAGSLPGERYVTISANVLPVNATDRNVEWSFTPAGRLYLEVDENDSNVVTISGLTEGEATLTATAIMDGSDGSPVSASVTINVSHSPAIDEPMPDFEWLFRQGYTLEFGTNFDITDEDGLFFTDDPPPPPTGNGDWFWIAREETPVTNHYHRFETRGQAGGRGTGANFDPIFGSSVHVHFDWRMPTGNIGGVRNAIQLSVLGHAGPLATVRAGTTGTDFVFEGSPTPGWWIAAYSGANLGSGDERSGTFYNPWRAGYDADRLQFLGGPGADFGMNTQGIWYTVDMSFDMNANEVTVTMRERGLPIDDPGAVTVVLPFSGTQIDGFAISVERGPEQNHGLTHQGLDNLFFFTLPHYDDTMVSFLAPESLGEPAEPNDPSENLIIWQNWFKQVYTGATLADLDLPETMEVVTADGRIVEALVSWRVTEMPWSTVLNGPASMAFDSSIPGVFTFTGTINDVPNLAYNRMSITPQIFVEVRTGLLHNFARPVEWLNRGVVAVPGRNGGMLVQWRILAPEYAMGMRFDVFRNGTQIASNLASTNFVDGGGRPGDVYTVSPSGGGSGNAEGNSGIALANNFLEIPLQRPTRRTNPAAAFGATSFYNNNDQIWYIANDMSVADVFSTGEYQVLVRWTTNMQRDPGLSARHTGETIFDLYTLDGELLWRINMGMNITSGEHHSVMHFFDLDNSGTANFAIKTADGTRVYHPDPETGLVLESHEGGTPVYVIGGNGSNNPFSNFNYHALLSPGFYLNWGDWVSHPDNVWIGGTTCPVRRVGNTGATGRINNGPEFFTVFDGRTGLPVDTIEYFAPYGIGRGGWGDANQNRSDRFNGAVAFMPKNGVSGAEPWPTIIEVRQHYYPSFVAAHQLIDGELITIWTYDRWSWGLPANLGNHQITVGDYTFNGYDDVSFGSVVLDYRGHVLWAANGTRGTVFADTHGDAMDKTPIFPGSSEFYRWTGLERGAPNNATLRHGSTGRPVMSYNSPEGDVGRAVMGNVTPLSGFEFWASGTEIVNAYTGETIHIMGGVGDDGQGYGDGFLPVNHMVYWTGALTREFLDGGPNQPLVISELGQFNFTREDFLNDDLPDELQGVRTNVQVLTGTLSNNGTKANPGLQADILGDWRENIIVRTNCGNSPGAFNDDSQAAIRIYITDFYTSYTLYTFMHDPNYRMAVSWQNAIYNQPPHLNFYLGEAVRDDVVAWNLPVPHVRFTGGQGLPSVTSVTVNPATAEVAQGDTRTFSAIVVVANHAPTGVVWSVSGHEGVEINQSGLLSVDENVPVGTELTVTAISTFNNARRGTATVTITPGTDIPTEEIPTEDVPTEDIPTDAPTYTVPPILPPTGGGLGNDQSPPIPQSNNAAARQETISISGEVNVNVRVQRERATLNLNTSTVRQIIETVDEEIGVATFDLSALDITEAMIPRQSVRQLADADVGIALILPQGTLVFDAEATYFLGQEARNNNILVSISTLDASGLPENLQLEPGQVVYQVRVTSGTQAINQFDGNLTVSLPYDGAIPVAVWIIDEDGNLQLIEPDAVFDAETGHVTFSTDTLGVFVLGYLAESVPDESASLPPISDVAPQETPVVLSLFMDNTTQVAAAVFIDPATDRAMIPLRHIAETLGAQVEWNNETRTVTIFTADGIVTLTIDQPLPDGMGSAIIIDDLTFVPLRFVASALGVDVEWDAEARAVHIVM